MAIAVDNVVAEATAIAINSDFLYQDAILSFAAAHAQTVRYYKRDFLFRPGTWRNIHVAPADSRGSGAVHAIGHSDFETSGWDLLRLLAICRPREVLASNLSAGAFVRRFCAADFFPLGLTNPTLESSKHEVFGDWSLVRQAALEPVRENYADGNRIYANFDRRTAPSHRNELAGLCEKLDHVEFGDMEVSKNGRLRYLRSMRDAGMVVCPQGNGLDTHRFYEALYVGAIPVVLGSSYSAIIASRFGLPHLTLRRWSDLADYRTLRRRASALRRETWDLRWITKSAWLAKLNEAAS